MFSGLAEVYETPVRRWTALVSFTLQATLVAAALVYPLLYPQSLPPVMRSLFLPASNPEAPYSHREILLTQAALRLNTRSWSTTGDGHLRHQTVGVTTLAPRKRQMST